MNIYGDYYVERCHGVQDPNTLVDSSRFENNKYLFVSIEKQTIN